MGLLGDHFCAPNHQNYFNYQNLSKLLVSNGFEIKDYWIDQNNQFNLYAFIKKFLIQSDQVTAFPPTKVTLKTIWKWQKVRSKSVILSNYSVIQENPAAENTSNSYNKNSLKNKIKRNISHIIPLKFQTHQIVLAKYEQ